MRKLRMVLLVVVLVASAFAVVRGLGGGLLWGALAAVGLAGEVFARHIERGGGGQTRGLRVYSWLFAAALVVVVGVWVALAVAGPREQRGGFVGMAILWSAMATGAVGIVVAAERRLRRDPTHQA